MRKIYCESYAVTAYSIRSLPTNKFYFTFKVKSENVKRQILYFQTDRVDPPGD